MRKGITAISAFSMTIAFMAGAVLCMQVTNLQPLPDLDVSGTLLRALEVAIFGTAVCIWRPSASVLGWVLGVAALLLTRSALTAAAGFGLAIAHEGADLAEEIQRASALGPRFAAVLFSLMVDYPLRAFLPSKEIRPARNERRSSATPSVVPATRSQGNGDDGLLIVTVKDRPGSAEPLSRPESVASRPALASIPQAAGPIEVPATALLAELPREMVTDKARRLCDSEQIALPGDKVLPQLREAQVVFSISEIIELLPPRAQKAVSDRPDLSEECVSIPLELIVPQLPLETFALPPASPPEWADVAQTDGVVFATV